MNTTIFLQSGFRNCFQSIIILSSFENKNLSDIQEYVKNIIYNFFHSKLKLWKHY
jgi:hypothetical protein